ncbi:hypothetical protein BDF21DRAFT_430664 [Thamnidium elegans]|nr:hypothetical protein BDF21DRAFT_430664 [Thamnidium elegans]
MFCWYIILILIIIHMQAKRPNKQETLAEKFMKYKQKIVHASATGLEFSLETNLPELIALSNVMLLKPSQFNRYTRDHFTDEVLNEWHKSILSTTIIDVEKEAQDISKSLDDLIYVCIYERLLHDKILFSLFDFG